MSDARRIPGQSILKRLGARGVQRPQIGATADFYERFGLADPWTVEERWVDSNEKSPFYFLSAAPYYARLRAMGRAARARRRILERLEAEPLALQGVASRMTGSIGVSLPSQQASMPRFGLRTVGTMHALDPRGTAELYFEALEASEEGEGEAVARPARRSRRSTSRRRAAKASAVRAQLAEIAPLARNAKQRRALKRAVEEIELLPEQERVHAARRIVRRIKGPASRIATTMVERTVERVDAAPAAVARTRALPHVGKGLRRILGSSPSMATLVQDTEPMSTAPGQPTPSAGASRTRAVEAVRPTAAPVPVARAAREARAQLQTGRAGPPAVEAPTGAAPVVGPARTVRRRPTARAMARTLAAPTTPATDLRRGFEASVPAPSISAVPRASRPMARAAERTQAGVRVDARGVPFVTPSVTSYIPARAVSPVRSAVRTEGSTIAPPVRLRRSRAVASQPSSWLRPGVAEPEVPEELADVPMARSTRSPRRASAARRAESRANAATTSAAAVRTEAPRSALPSVVSARPLHTPPAARAALRAEPAPRRDTTGRSMLSPAPVAHVPAASVRRSRLVAPSAVAIVPRLEIDEAPVTTEGASPTMARPVVRRSRPTRTVGGSLPTTGTEIVAAPRSSAMPASPVLRAAARGESVPTERVALARSPMPHVVARHAEAVVQPPSLGVAAPALERRSNTRRSRVVAPSATPVQPMGVDVQPEAELAPSPAATATSAPTARARRPGRETQRPVQPAPMRERLSGAPVAATVAPTMRAAARSVRAPARDDRGSEVVVAKPTSYVRRPVDPLANPVSAATESVSRRIIARADAPTAAPSASLEADRPAIAVTRAEGSTRRSRVVAPSATLPVSPTETEDAAVAVQPAQSMPSTQRRASRATAHAVRRVVHAAREAAPVRSLPERVAARQAVPAGRGADGGASRRTAARSVAGAVSSSERPRRAVRGARRSLMPRATAPITLAIPAFGAVEGESAEMSPAVPTGSARVAPPRMAPATTVSVDDVVDRVSSAIRAALRGEEPIIVLDAARRVLRVRTELPDNGPLERAGGRLGTPAPTRPRFAPSSPGFALASPAEAYAMGLDTEDFGPAPASVPGAAPSSRAPARRSAGVPATRPVVAAAGAPRRRGSARVPQSTRPSPASRVLSRRYPAGNVTPRWTRVRADGTVVRVPAAERSEVRSRVEDRAPRAAARADLLRTGPGFGSPDLGSLAQPMTQTAPTAEGAVARPLARTLGQMDAARAPLPGSPASPGWAQRAVHGSAATTREQIRARKALRSDSGLFTALAQSSTPDEVVRVILERGDSVSSVRDQLGAPAAAMVERIVRMRRDVANTDAVIQPGGSAQVPNGDGLVPEDITAGAPLPGATRRARSVRGMPSSFLASAASSNGVGASNVMKLAGKLQQLIHLAENERRLSEAQAQVRMATERVSEGISAAGPNADSGDETPDIGALQRDVLHAVMTELELFKLRRQEDPDGPDRW